MVDRYGAQAVYGRTLTTLEMRTMARANQVWDAYQARKASGLSPEWADRHPIENELLNTLMLQVNNG